MKIQIIHDSSVETPLLGSAYMNCSRCLAERPKDQTPREWARQQVSILNDGRIQVQCTRHMLNITTISFKLVE